MDRVVKVTVDSDIPFIKGLLEPFAEVQYLKGSDIKRDLIADSDALIIRTRTKCNSELLSGSKVKFIASATIGSDHVDLEWCKESGIYFTNAAGCNAWGVVQYVLTSIFYLYDKAGESPEGKVLGIVGAGNVGERLASLAQSLGFKVLRCDPPLKSLLKKDPLYFSPEVASVRDEGVPFRVDRSDVSEGDYYELMSVLNLSDIVSLHVPLNPSTINMANDEFFKSMKDGAIFINSSRGEVVSEESLVRYRDKFSGIVLDVWKGEPQLNKNLLTFADITTPHIAGYSLQGKINASVVSLNNFGRFFGIETLSKLEIEYPEPKKLRFVPLRESDPYINLSNLIFSLYDIGEDSKALKENPDLFESLRNGYKYRDEYSDEVKEMFEIIINREYV
ncbi:MAG: 4-phosphoerythronate dehydrogenase [Bacteroidales bacterium]|jgi:erythronate-4-phosphate dehydrogenase|nr:4-phosphoerythronate dehydrogenase [Bacteroidales bacterium]